MASRKVSIEQSRASLLERVAAWQRAMDEACAQAAEELKKPLGITPHDAHLFASRLSARFPTVRVSMVFSGGAASTTVEPIPFKYDARNRALDSLRYDVEKFENMDPRRHWPTHDELAAYARGFEDADKDSRDTIASLKRQLEFASRPTLSNGPFMVLRG